MTREKSPNDLCCTFGSAAAASASVGPARPEISPNIPGGSRAAGAVATRAAVRDIPRALLRILYVVITWSSSSHHVVIK